VVTVNAPALATLQDNLRQAFDAIEADRDRALQDPRANADQIQIAANRRMSAALIAYRALIATTRETGRS
jgi:hypothetical protein